jgi:hypothetical protein
VKHVVRLGIEGDLIHAIQGGQQRGELVGLIDEEIFGRTGTHFDTE